MKTAVGGWVPKVLLGLGALVVVLIWRFGPVTGGEPVLGVQVAPGQARESAAEAESLGDANGGVADRETLGDPELEIPAEPTDSAELPGGEIRPEWTLNEVGDLRVPLPVGVIAGLVIDRGEPVPDGRVLLAKNQGLWEPGNPDRSFELATSLSDDGTFEFSGLEPGGYLVGIDCEGRTLHQISLRLKPEQPIERIIVQFSTTALTGHVYDGEGRPTPGAWVSVSADAGVPSDDYRAFVLSDSKGEYLLEGLPSGSYWASMSRGSRRLPWDSESSVRVSLTQGEVRVLDFGRAVGLPRWTGTVRLRDGRPSPLTGSLHLSHSGPGGYGEYSIDDEGRFEIRLLPGSYRGVRLQPRGVQLGLALDFDDFLMGEEDRIADIVLPGTMVSGQVWNDATSEVLDASLYSNMRISIAPEGQGGWATLSSEISGEGRFHFIGLEPGRWMLRGWPLALVGMPDGGFPIEIRESDIEIVFDVHVTSKR